MRCRLYIGLGLWLAAACVRAAEVITVDVEKHVLEITPSFKKSWNLGEAVCVVRAGAQLGCGFILEPTARGARVQMTLMSGHPIHKGDYVNRVASTAQVFQVLVDKKTVAITHEANRRWQPGDTVCLYRKHEPLGCGEVGRSLELTARLDLFWSSGVSVKVGDSVREAPGKTRVVRVEETANRLVLSQTLVRPWKVGDTLAVIMQGEPVAWGEVTKSYPLSVEVQILATKGTFDAGDWAKPMPLPDAIRQANEDPLTRGPTALLEEFQFRDARRQVVSIGLVSTALRVGYDRALLPRVTVGGAVHVSRLGLGGASVSWWGVQGTLTYFPKGFPKGLWFQMGAGLASLTAARAGVEETYLTPTISTMAGWRWALSHSWNIGAGAGVLFLTRTSGERVFVNSSGVLPSVQLDFGVSF